MNQKALSFLGLAKRAGKVVSGEFATEKAVKALKAHLVLVAEDASGNTKKKFTDMCSYYKTELRICGSKEELGHAIGCEYRASAAVTDEKMARALLGKIDAAEAETGT